MFIPANQPPFIDTVMFLVFLCLFYFPFFMLFKLLNKTRYICYTLCSSCFE